MGRLRRKGRRPALGSIVGEKGRARAVWGIGTGWKRAKLSQRELSGWAVPVPCGVVILDGSGEILPFFGWHQPFQPPHLLLPFFYITPS